MAQHPAPAPLRVAASPFIPTSIMILAVILLALLGSGARADETTDRSAIQALLDSFHGAAAAADLEGYLDHFAQNAVFMGTDDWERWPLEDFRTYVKERFAGGTGWTYVPRDRHLAFDATGNTAWFDEIAVSPRWGRFRGTGVVVREAGAWKIAHYSLTALVPNERFVDVAEVTKEGFEQRDAEGNRNK